MLTKTMKMRWSFTPAQGPPGRGGRFETRLSSTLASTDVWISRTAQTDVNQDKMYGSTTAMGGRTRTGSGISDNSNFFLQIPCHLGFP